MSVCALWLTVSISCSTTPHFGQPEQPVERVSCKEITLKCDEDKTYDACVDALSCVFLRLESCEQEVKALRKSIKAMEE